MKEALSYSETSVLKESHGVTSQKAAFFIVTAVKTSYTARYNFSGGLSYDMLVLKLP
jgi:hypothetical protein